MQWGLEDCQPPAGGRHSSPALCWRRATLSLSAGVLRCDLDRSHDSRMRGAHSVQCKGSRRRPPLEDAENGKILTHCRPQFLLQSPPSLSSFLIHLCPIVFLSKGLHYTHIHRVKCPGLVSDTVLNIKLLYRELHFSRPISAISVVKASRYLTYRLTHNSLNQSPIILAICNHLQFFAIIMVPG